MPSPCGLNAQCQDIGGQPSCSCLPQFIGSPPNCKPECIINSECPYHLACINMKCRDPCPGSCGHNTECKVISHAPKCYCLPGYIGNPIIQCNIQQAEPVPQEYINPCQPSPCGSNAVCKEQNGAGSCTCLPEYFGDPYRGCMPECVVNSDCPQNEACRRNKCENPCPGLCGQNAECQTINHVPMCTCSNGYTGDPFRYCSIIPPQRN